MLLVLLALAIQTAHCGGATIAAVARVRATVVGAAVVRRGVIVVVLVLLLLLLSAVFVSN